MPQPDSHPPQVSSEPRLEPHLRSWILRELAAVPDARLDPDTPLFEALLDSTSVLALVSHLEEEYGLEIRDSEVVPGNFSTLRRIEAFLFRKLRPTATQAVAGASEIAGLAL